MSLANGCVSIAATSSDMAQTVRAYLSSVEHLCGVAYPFRVVSRTERTVELDGLAALIEQSAIARRRLYI